MKPSIGRIVHFYDDDDREDPEAAIVARVCEDVEHGPMHVDLVVLGVQRLGFELAVPFRESVPEAETSDGGRFWTWPPRVS